MCSLSQKKNSRTVINRTDLKATRRTRTMHFSVLFLVALEPTLCLRTQHARLPSRPRCATPLLASPGDELEKKTNSEGDELAAEFARRLEQEGGRHRFLLRTTVSEWRESAREHVRGAADSAKRMELMAPEKVSNASPVALLGGLLALTLLTTAYQLMAAPEVVDASSAYQAPEYGL